MYSIECVSDYISAMREKFVDGSPYIILPTSNTKVAKLSISLTDIPLYEIARGPTTRIQATTSSTDWKIMDPPHSTFCDEDKCLSTSWNLIQTVDEKTLDSHACDSTGTKWYSSKDDQDLSTSGSTSEDSSSGLSTGTIIEIICGCVAVLLVVAIVLFFYLRRSKGKYAGQLTTTLLSGDMTSLQAEMEGQNGLWNDDIITAKRIPRDKVKVKKLLSRGAFGEVYSGISNGQLVAIKMLIPATRSSIKHVNDFLAEAKMTATMEHPHIVSFVAVAWDSLSDICVILEFMDNGDLRALLDKYLASKRQVGFDKQKATIALHVSHALTYLHSLAPPVIHRDLKSRNILLNQAMEAKVTDFGISKERLDQTMTAGVGTSLWMAPEMMMGEQYDDKADMFSFGVVLSELDVHTLPYAQAKQRNLDTTWRQLTDAALLQNITTGVARVEFSELSPPSMVELGYACVSVEPSDRPSAAEVLYRLQVILSKDLE